MGTIVAEQKQEYVMQDREARELYEMRQKAERDRISELNTAEQKGMEKGLLKGEQIGLKKGRLEGLQEGRLELSLELLALLDKGYTVENIRRELASRS